MSAGKGAMGRAMTIGATAAILFAASPMAVTFGANGQGFEKFAGGWSGDGTVRLSSGGVERIRCRGADVPEGSDRLRLNLACASDSFKVQIASDMVRQGDSVQGTWSEANFGASGHLTGSIRGDRIDASIDGLGVSGRLTLALRGAVQAVSLTTQSSKISGTATVTLHRR